MKVYIVCLVIILIFHIVCLLCGSGSIIDMSQMLEVQAGLYWFSPKLSVWTQDQVSDCFDSFLVSNATLLGFRAQCSAFIVLCFEHPANVPAGILCRCMMGSASTEDSVIHYVQPSLGEGI